MKLPAAKSERVKIYVLIGIGSAGVLYAVWSVGISYCRKSRLDFGFGRREDGEIRVYE